MMTRRIPTTLLLVISVIASWAQGPVLKKVCQTDTLKRFLSYIQIESQLIDEPDMLSFPMTEGQKAIAQHIYDEAKNFGGKNVKVPLSNDYYVYIDIPSNIN